MAAALDFGSFDLFPQIPNFASKLRLVEIPSNDSAFSILENDDGSLPVILEFSDASNSYMTKKDMFVTVTLPLLIAAVGLLAVAGAMYARLDDAIDRQRIEIGGDIKEITTKIDTQSQTAMRLEVGMEKISSEISKSKSELLQKVSELSSRQVILEAKAVPASGK